MNFQDTITSYLRAAFPILYVQTHEELRVEAELHTVAEHRTRPLWRWSLTMGWVNSTQAIQAGDPLSALDQLTDLPEGSLCILRDFHFFLDSPAVIRKLRDLIPTLKATGRTVIIVACQVAIPSELSKDITIVEFTLPTKADLDQILTTVIQSAEDPDAIAVDNRPALLDAARGLTAAEAENVFALALVRHKAFPLDAIRTVQTEKAAAVKKTGILEYYEPQIDLTQVGGLNNLKAWLKKRSRAFSDEARAYGLPAPRGIMLIGPPGTGKSLTAKAIAATWNLPLIRLDMSRIFGSLVGQTEANMRQACALIEAMAPAVCWVDEIEKGASGLGSSGATDSGTTARAIGILLTWMQERTQPVFVVATANNVTALPPELLRKGRFDEIFALDLPTHVERADILRIHLSKRGRDPNAFDLGALTAASEHSTGAEIEEAIITGLYDAFDDARDLKTDDVLSAFRRSTPLAIMMKEHLDTLRQWAKRRARPATIPDDAPRKVRNLHVTPN